MIASHRSLWIQKEYTSLSIKFGDLCILHQRLYLKSSAATPDSLTSIAKELPAYVSNDKKLLWTLGKGTVRSNQGAKCSPIHDLHCP